MEKEKPIVLIGFMATGKSTVGRIVAERTGRAFVDLDALITEEAGARVADIFRTEGEAGFRRREAAALQHGLERGAIVMATGGGAACREDNLTLMLASGFVVALSAPPDEIIRRTGGASGRPLLDGRADALGTATALLAEREPFYARAHARVDTVGRSAAEVADAVLAAMRSFRSGSENEKQES